jgi:hypothetical protein
VAALAEGLLLRRAGPRSAAVLTAGDLMLDRTTRRCHRGEVALQEVPYGNSVWLPESRTVDRLLS